MTPSLPFFRDPKISLKEALFFDKIALYSAVELPPTPLSCFCSLMVFLTHPTLNGTQSLIMLRFFPLGPVPLIPLPSYRPIRKTENAMRFYCP